MAPTTGYATVAHVQALLKSASGVGVTIGESSTPTTSDVENFLDQVASEIDAILTANGYGTVPATGANDVFLLRRYVSEKAAAATWHAAYGGFDDPPARVKRWEDDYKAFLTRLVKKQQRLIDQEPRGRIGMIYAARYTGD